MADNPNCNGNHCLSSHGQVRVLPLPGEASQIFCWSCFAHEINWRRQRNRELHSGARYDLPEWDALEAYEG